MPKPSHEVLLRRMKERWRPEDSPKCFSDVVHLVFERETHWLGIDLRLANKPQESTCLCLPRPAIISACGHKLFSLITWN